MCRNIDNEHGDFRSGLGCIRTTTNIGHKLKNLKSDRHHQAHQLLIKIQTIVSSVKDQAISEKRLSSDTSNYVNLHSLMSIHLFISKLQSSNKLYF